MLKWIAIGMLTLAATCQNPADTGAPVEDEVVVEDAMAADDGGAGQATTDEAATGEETANADGVRENPASGLVEREPDLCHAADYQEYVGQPGTIIDTLDISRSYRIEETGAIVTQEYDGLRINFHLDADGVISKVDCG